jgi:hypothetical protein
MWSKGKGWMRIDGAAVMIHTVKSVPQVSIREDLRGAALMMSLSLFVNCGGGGSCRSGSRERPGNLAHQRQLIPVRIAELREP